MSYYISQFDDGTDLQQPHNFVLINGEQPVFNLPLQYHEQPNYKLQYQWLNSSKFGLPKSFFDPVLSQREFANASDTTVIINSSTAKLRMELTKNDLSLKTDNANSTKQSKTSLLILDQDSFSEKAARFVNLATQSGELSFTFGSQRKFSFPSTSCK